MALLNFPASPYNGELYPVAPSVGQNQYIWEAPTSTWRLLGPVSGVAVGCYGSATSVGRFCVDLQGRVVFAEDVSLLDSFVALNNPAAYNSYVWPNTDGATGEVLTTDGAGNLTWVVARPDAGLGLMYDGNFLKVSLPIGSTPPTIGSGQQQAVPGSVYWDSTIGQLFIYYDDGTTAQWVTTCPVTDVPGAGLGVGLENNNFKTSIPSLSGPPTVGIGSNEAMVGSMYFDTNYGSFFYYYYDGFTYQWVQVV
jgi:hypothetical protein